MQITCVIASASAPSVPGRMISTSSDLAAASVLRTSIVTMCAPRRFAASKCRAVFGWLARLAAQRRMSRECSPMSSFVLVSSMPVSPSPKAPRPQQIMVGLQNWLPWKLAKRARSCALMRVP